MSPDIIQCPLGGHSQPNRQPLIYTKRRKKAFKSAQVRFCGQTAANLGKVCLQSILDFKTAEKGLYVCIKFGGKEGLRGSGKVVRKASWRSENLNTEQAYSFHKYLLTDPQLTILQQTRETAFLPS